MVMQHSHTKVAAVKRDELHHKFQGAVKTSTLGSGATPQLDETARSLLKQVLDAHEELLTARSKPGAKAFLGEHDIFIRHKLLGLWPAGTMSVSDILHAAGRNTQEEPNSPKPTIPSPSAKNRKPTNDTGDAGDTTESSENDIRE